MAFRPKASRQRYDEYRRRLIARRRNEQPAAAELAERNGAPHAPRHRSFVALLLAFRELVAEYQGAIAFALATLTFSTLLNLVPPAATKITIDYILLGHPWPQAWSSWRVLALDKATILTLVAAAVIAISTLEAIIHLWGRWYATRVTKRIQMSVRRRVFEHAVRLPLDRVYQLKSGGVASILREDAGGIGDLIFSLLYNPWRALIQLAGSIAVLAWVDWRLLLGSEASTAMLPAS